jgi:CPA2 family monovalent cation:H+ antiporter-2
VTENSKFVGKTIRESGIRNKYHCLVVGVESSGDMSLRQPDVDAELQQGDIVWVVGEESALNALFED